MDKLLSYFQVMGKVIIVDLVPNHQFIVDTWCEQYMNLWLIFHIWRINDYIWKLDIWHTFSTIVFIIINYNLPYVFDTLRIYWYMKLLLIHEKISTHLNIGRI